MSEFPNHTDTHKKIVDVCQKSHQDGYFCYDEMFVWANYALDQCPSIAASLKKRFPLVFIDEVQDNSELQSALLHRIFFGGENPSVRQRFGDSNQAIFQHNEQSAVTDTFPVSPHVDLPNSHRFGREIAKLAEPLGVRPHGLVGCGPRYSPSLGKPTNTIFLFDEDSVQAVLPKFAQLLLDSFTSDEIAKAHFSAVAAVHNKDGDDRVPRSLKHYAPDYDPTIVSKDCQPATLLQYVHSALRHTIETANVFQLVRGFADGIVRLTIMLPGSTAKETLSRSAHRAIENCLSEHPERMKDYRSSLRILIDAAGLPTQVQWENDICPSVRRIVAVLTGLSSLNATGQTFLAWTQPGFGETSAVQTRHRENVFSFPEHKPAVRIHLGSIHSVKGETHAATLVLDTFFIKHHLAELKPWLLGEKSGGAADSSTLQSRLRLHYVAMTRPANLLCLAMRYDALSDNERATLEKRGWQLVRCIPIEEGTTASTVNERHDGLE
jgi:DNA helicase II / ATP-dependent DNA helicase PcrA